MDISKLKLEMSFIKHEDIKQFLINALKEVPSYFEIMPASTSGRYHPSYALGEGGLLRHTRVAAYVAQDILNLEHMRNIFTEREKDLILVAIILHDTHKRGTDLTGHTVHEHPLLAADFVRMQSGLNEEEREYIATGIASHMGQWNENKRNKFILPKPTTLHQQFVHMCDYLASRKYLEFQFPDDELPEPVEITNPGEFVITFGKKHSGKTIEEIARVDKGYLEFLISSKCNIGSHPCLPYVRKYLGK